jgi:hypothetical protein
MTSILRILLAPVAAALALTTCVDVTPLAYDPPTYVGLTDGGPADAADDGKPVATDCTACIYRYAAQGVPGCQDKVDLCNASGPCASLLACVSVRGCFAAKDQNALTLCAFPCAVEAGVLGYGDPNLDLIYALLDCTKTCPACAAP